MMKTNNHIGLYIHIPFCKRKCNYCGFLSFQCDKETVLSEYAKALIMEIRTRYEEWPYRIVDSIFIGGGTPSVMAADDMVSIVNEIRENFTLSDDCEITIEVNPGTVNDEKMHKYLGCGINRISIGIQSFDNFILNMMGRIHDKNDAIRAVRVAKRAGFRNINIDLMFGVPGQTQKMWKDSLRQCIFLNPQHISLYSLQVEENTPFYKMIYEDKIINEMPEASDREMYHSAQLMLELNGYNHYEISNAAIPGFESRHNLKYWSYDEYLGLGLGASSFIGGHRFKNCSRMTDYLKHIKAGLPPVKKDDVESYSLRDEMGIYVFTGLRKTAGFRISDFEKEFGHDFFDIYDPYILKELQGLIVADGDILRLTNKGLDVSNRVMAAFV